MDCFFPCMQSLIRLIGHWIVVRSIINGHFQSKRSNGVGGDTLIQSTSLICRDFQLAHPGKRTASHRHIASCPPMVASPERRACFIYLSSFTSRRVFIYFPCGLVFAPESSSLWLRSSFSRLFLHHSPGFSQTLFSWSQKAKNHLRQFRTTWHQESRTTWRNSIQKVGNGLHQRLALSTIPCSIILTPFRPPSSLLSKPCVYSSGRCWMNRSMH